MNHIQASDPTWLEVETGSRRQFSWNLPCKAGGLTGFMQLFGVGGKPFIVFVSEQEMGVVQAANFPC